MREEYSNSWNLGVSCRKPSFHYDEILPRRGPITKAMARRLQEDSARNTGEGPKVLMSLRVDFGSMD